MRRNKKTLRAAHKKLMVWRITNFIDFFYPKFLKPYMSIQIFRYGVCGSFSTSLDIVLYFIFYHYVYLEQDVIILIWHIAAYTAALVSSFCLYFPVAFYLNRLIVFPKSKSRKQAQFFKFLAVTFLNLFLNYILLKVLIEYFNFFPTIAKILTTVIIICISFVLQRGFSFK
ncbi:MAG: GtrA family protein [Alphaproteobacteria bacterium]|nr:GtrA family protein [Alphaproteobacteria bacterium]